jgi:SPP1 family predicted phage head-tail adaptor
MLRAGTLRDRITLMASARTTDARWGTAEGWTEYATAWANVTPTDGTEFFTDKGVQTAVTHLVRMRYRPDVKATDQILYGNLTLDILSVIDPDGRKRELLITTK